ncbi:MAG: hypothetical protein ACODAA_08490, partial [Gemmatimonadota bacterium]
RADASIDAGLREQLKVRMQTPFDRLWTRFGELEEQEARLVELLGAYEDGPPGDGDSRVDEAADDWRATLGRLDTGYVGAWRELVEEIEKTWSSELLPRLVETATRKREGLPEWVLLVGLGVLTLSIVAAVVFLLI